MIMSDWNNIILKLMIIQEYGKTQLYKNRATDLLNAIEKYLKTKRDDK